MVIKMVGNGVCLQDERVDGNSGLGIGYWPKKISFCSFCFFCWVVQPVLRYLPLLFRAVVRVMLQVPL